MISKELAETLGFAVREAKRRRHEYVSIEHVLMAILHDEKGRLVVEGCGGNVQNLINALERFFSERISPVPMNTDYVLQQTVGFQRVIQRAVNHAQSAEKSEVTVGDVLASIFNEDQSHARYFLSQEGITRLDVLNFISHGITQERDEPGSATEPDAKTPSKKKKTYIEEFTTDLVALAEAGKIDPLIGRADELTRAIQVLCRRRKNNPVFVGDPGVGKTAMAEGLAMRIHEGNVPDLVKGVRVYALDLGGMLAGTKFRGDFEQRLKGVLKELSKLDNAILFIDEIHTIVGAGATSGGSMDASNILKPLLQSGGLRCIGSTTYEEYKNHFEKDRALSRRFEKIEILEPSVEDTYKILKGLKSRYEEHHGIVYSDAALKSASELSARYINDRFLPDKAIDVIDEVGSYMRLSGQGRRKKVHPADIEKIVAKIARIPTVSVSESDRDKLEDLDERLSSVVFGQDLAIQATVKAIKRSRAGLRSEEKPVGSFLFTGPTGVGKTEVAKQLAVAMGVQFLRFDMSEYMEKHTVARLIGAPPGYIGFDQAGLLTDGIRRNPYCVLLLDEIEKAHEDLYNILLQVLDHATLTDNNGKKADFRNVIIIMTSNAGAREMSGRSIGFGTDSGPAVDKSLKALERIFSPEFRNRLDGIVTFNALTVEIMERIVDKFIGQLNGQISDKKVSIQLTAATRRWLAEKGHDPRYGARPLDRLIQDKIKNRLADEILFGALAKGGTAMVDMVSDEPVFTFV
jgi:ATP-dependent Clp protease ATP-binding subunit ClpA